MTGGVPKVTPMALVEAEKVSWLWPGYLPLGKLVTLDGDPGVGKSTLALDIAARISTGSPMPDGAAPVKGAALILTAEDGLSDTVRPRLDAAGADPARVSALEGVLSYTPEGDRIERAVSLPGDVAALGQAIEDTGALLVVIDVLMAFLSGAVNSHRDQDVRRALYPLAALADLHRCCILLLRHLNKSGGGASPLYRGGGSIGIVGAARAAFMCGRDPDDESGRRRVFAPVKSNLAAEPPALAYRLVSDELRGCARVAWDGVSAHGAGALLAEPSDPDERTEQDEAAGWLREYLTRQPGGGAKAGDVIKAARGDGIAQRTLQRARSRAGVRTQKATFGGGWVWQYNPQDDSEGAEHAKGIAMAPSAPSVASSPPIEWPPGSNGAETEHGE